MRFITLAILAFLAFDASSADLTVRDLYQARHGDMHFHPGNAEQWRQQDPREVPGTCLKNAQCLARGVPDACCTGARAGRCTCAGRTRSHSYGTATQVCQQALDAGLDFVVVTPHLDAFGVGFSSGRAWFTAKTEDFIEYHGAVIPRNVNGFPRPVSGGFTRNEWEWFEEEMSAFNRAHPGFVCTGHAEWSTRACGGPKQPPCDGRPLSGGHRVIACAEAGFGTDARIMDPPCVHVAGQSDPNARCASETELYATMARQECVGIVAHACSSTSAWLDPARPSDPAAPASYFDNELMTGYAIGAKNSNQFIPGGGCLAEGSGNAFNRISYTTALNKGLRLYPASGRDSHYAPQLDGSGGCQTCYPPASNGHTVVLTRTWDAAEMVQALKEGRQFWSREQNGSGSAWFQAHESDLNDPPDAILGDATWIPEDPTDVWFYGEAAVGSGRRSINEWQLWHNSDVAPVASGSAECVSNRCEVSYNCNPSNHPEGCDGWWLLVAQRRGRIREIITAPIWVNYETWRSRR